MVEELPLCYHKYRCGVMNGALLLCAVCKMTPHAPHAGQQLPDAMLLQERWQLGQFQGRREWFPEVASMLGD